MDYHVQLARSYVLTSLQIVFIFSAKYNRAVTFVSVEHTKRRTYTNAMTAWMESGPSGYLHVCTRELQNFDGMHEGIRLVSLLLFT